MDLHQNMLKGEQSRDTKYVGSKAMDKDSVQQPANAMVDISSSHGQEDSTKAFQEIQSGRSSP